MTGSGDVGAITYGAAPGIAKVTVSGPGQLFAFNSAWRSDPAPESFVLTTTNDGTGTGRTSNEAEDCGVSAGTAGAVAVMT